MTGQFLNYVRSKINHMYDPSMEFKTEEGLSEDLSIPHNGLYISVEYSDGKEIARDGFIKKECLNVIESLDTVIQNVFSTMKSSNVSLSSFMSSKVYLTVIKGCDYMADPMLWDENTDGVYFQWGQKYHGLYLPHQIKKMNVTKSQVLDRLCAWEAGVASNLWRLPEGLVWKITCDTVS